MAPQSQHRQTDAPVVLLTRPAAQSLRFARSLRRAFASPLQVMISPLLQPAFLCPALPQMTPAGLIFSSETGVQAYARMAGRPHAPAWCVGKRTAKEAKSAGLEPVFVAADAASLVAHMLAQQPSGAFLHLRGQDTTVDLAQSLTEGGVLTAAAIVYNQRPMPLSPRALRMMQSGRPVIVPVFSPRSMQLFCKAAPNGAQLHFAAFSAAVASALSYPAPAQVAVCARPDAQAMLSTVLSLLSQLATP